MDFHEKFVGGEQWATFFIGLIVFSLIATVFLAFILNLFSGLIIGLSLFVIISIFTLIRGYTFFYRNYPQCQDIDGAAFYAVPEKHAVMVTINGQYPERPLYAGFYFVFPFFSLIKIDQVIFLGDFNGVIFDGDPRNKIDFDNSISTSITAGYIAKVYSGPEVGSDLWAADHELISTIAILLNRGEAEIRNLVSVTQELKDSILDSCVKRYARESKADNNIKELLTSLLRLTLGSMDSSDARKKKTSLDDLKAKDSSVFNSIARNYGIEIRSINISDIELSEEEIKINRAIYESKIEIDIAENKKEAIKISADAEAEAMRITAEALEEKVRRLVSVPGTTPEKVLDYLTKMEQWKSLKATDKSFIIENGGSIAGIIAALKGIK